jgi:DNA-binding XRE family transcriptional regulator
MKTHRFEDLAVQKLGKEKHERIRREVRAEVTRERAAALELSLREAREMAGKTQAEVAELAKMAQSEVSKIERREDRLISTVRHYIEALGGELELVARFGDKTVRLRGV